jgi:hypothetical protein
MDRKASGVILAVILAAFLIFGGCVACCMSGAVIGHIGETAEPTP